MLRTVLLLAGVTSDGGIKNLSTFTPCTHGLRPGPARFPRHDAALCTDMTFHADVGILSRGYSDWGIA